MSCEFFGGPKSRTRALNGAWTFGLPKPLNAKLLCVRSVFGQQCLGTNCEHNLSLLNVRTSEPKDARSEEG